MLQSEQSSMLWHSVHENSASFTPQSPQGVVRPPPCARTCNCIALLFNMMEEFETVLLPINNLESVVVCR